MGVFVYADDIFLLSASRPGLQAMLKECENYASQYIFDQMSIISSSPQILTLKSLKRNASFSVPKQAVELELTK